MKALLVLLLLGSSARAEVLAQGKGFTLERGDGGGAATKAKALRIFTRVDGYAVDYVPAGKTAEVSGARLVLTLDGDKGGKQVRHVEDDDVDTHEILGGKGEVTILLEDRRAAVSKLLIEDGATVPLHDHPGSAEILYVLAGGGELTIDGQVVEVKPETTYLIPAGAKHAFTARGMFAAVQLYVPGGPEQRFKPTKKAK